MLCAVAPSVCAWRGQTKAGDLASGQAHFFWVELVIQNEPFDPLHLGFFGGASVVFEPDGRANLVKQLGAVWFDIQVSLFVFFWGSCVNRF